MAFDTFCPQEQLTSEDWQSLISFFELLIQADKKEKVLKYEPDQEATPVS